MGQVKNWEMELSNMRQKMISLEKEKQVYQTKAKYTIENMKKEFLTLQKDVKTAIDINIRRDEQITRLNHRLKNADKETNEYRNKLNEAQHMFKGIENTELANATLKKEFSFKQKELEDNLS